MNHHTMTCLWGLSPDVGLGSSTEAGVSEEDALGARGGHECLCVSVAHVEVDAPRRIGATEPRLLASMREMRSLFNRGISRQVRHFIVRIATDLGLLHIRPK